MVSELGLASANAVPNNINYFNNKISKEGKRPVIYILKQKIKYDDS